MHYQRWKRHLMAQPKAEREEYEALAIEQKKLLPPRQGRRLSAEEDEFTELDELFEKRKKANPAIESAAKRKTKDH